jgi:hypothetical protein
MKRKFEEEETVGPLVKKTKRVLHWSDFASRDARLYLMRQLSALRKENEFRRLYEMIQKIFERVTQAVFRKLSDLLDALPTVKQIARVRRLLALNGFKVTQKMLVFSKRFPNDSSEKKRWIAPPSIRNLYEQYPPYPHSMFDDNQLLSLLGWFSICLSQMSHLNNPNDFTIASNEMVNWWPTLSASLLLLSKGGGSPLLDSPLVEETKKKGPVAPFLKRLPKELEQMVCHFLSTNDLLNGLQATCRSMSQPNLLWMHTVDCGGRRQHFLHILQDVPLGQSKMTIKHLRGLSLGTRWMSFRFPLLESVEFTFSKGTQKELLQYFLKEHLLLKKTVFKPSGCSWNLSKQLQGAQKELQHLREIVFDATDIVHPFDDEVSFEWWIQVTRWSKSLSEPLPSLRIVLKNIDNHSLGVEICEALTQIGQVKNITYVAFSHEQNAFGALVDKCMNYMVSFSVGAPHIVQLTKTGATGPSFVE